jgi:hypothetical protein
MTKIYLALVEGIGVLKFDTKTERYATVRRLKKAYRNISITTGEARSL